MSCDVILDPSFEDPKDPIADVLAALRTDEQAVSRIASPQLTMSMCGTLGRTLTRQGGGAPNHRLKD